MSGEVRDAMGIVRGITTDPMGKSIAIGMFHDPEVTSKNLYIPLILMIF